MSAGTSRGARDTIALTLIALIAVGLRLLALRWAPPLEGDSAHYIALARRLASAGMFSADGIRPSTYRPPLYPALLAVAYRLRLPMPGSVLILQCVTGAATVVVVFFLARHAFGRRTALLSAGALAVAPMSVRYSATLLTETMFTFLVVSASMLWLAKRFAGSGALFGLATLTRAALWPFILLLTGLGIATRQRAAIVIACAAALTVGPWLARNYRETGRVTIADAGFGTNLLFGAVRLHTGNPWGQLMKDATGDVAQDQAAAEREAGREALRRIAEAPGAWLMTRARQYPWLFLDNGVYLPVAANDMTFSRAEAEGRWATVAIKGGFVAGNAAILVLALAGLWRNRTRWLELIPIWTVPAYIAVSHLPMYVEPRYGLPIEPYLLILAASALDRRASGEARVLP